MYSVTLSLTLALDGNGWSPPRRSGFVPGKETRYPLCGTKGRSGRVWKNSSLPASDPRTVQPVASGCTAFNEIVKQIIYVLSYDNYQ
jgi:hypothetical protein